MCIYYFNQSDVKVLDVDSIGKDIFYFTTRRHDFSQHQKSEIFGHNKRFFCTEFAY